MIKCADDTNLIVTSKTVEELHAKAEEIFDLGTCWFSTSRLILYKEKTDIFLTLLTKQCKTPKPLQIDLSNNILDLNEIAKLLYYTYILFL